MSRYIIFFAVAGNTTHLQEVIVIYLLYGCNIAV